MAVIDTDTFSNVSWQDEHNSAEAAGSSAFHPQEMPDTEPSSAQPVTPAHEQEIRANELFVGEILECTVSSPVKENDGTKDAFVSYLITTNVLATPKLQGVTTFKTFQKPSASVRRRFTDFVFLWKQLCKEYLASAIPPLPDKQRMEYVRGDRFGTEFTARRAHSLQRFLSRLSLHPILRRAPILHAFLESPDWNATMRARSSRGSGAGMSPTAAEPTTGVFDTFADSFINVFAKPHRFDKRFLEVKEKADRLDDDLSQVEKVVARVGRRELDIETDLRDLAEQMQKLIALEPGVGDAARAFVLGLEDQAKGMHKLREVTDGDYLGSLRDMSAYTASLKGLLKSREQKQLDFEQLTEYLNKASHERDAGMQGSFSSSGSGIVGAAGGFIRSKVEDVRGVDHEASRRERMRKLELRIEELTIEVERAKQTSAMFDEEVVREVTDFERIKRVEFKRQLGGLADAHVEFYGNVEDIWGRYVEEMEGDDAHGGGGRMSPDGIGEVESIDGMNCIEEDAAMAQEVWS
ncbi:hypothetical protein MKZ38_001785 [Zalerion maritima]|uniref:Sorting nexin-4 n=1 Tax=Zalerion maritima TaxID=339359 RepID=A0AAD5RXE5_9PEZI|nr:hypothetical protein MKZ38_001785 [Zalerion maritima]